MKGHLYFNYQYLKGRTSTWILLALLVTIAFLAYIVLPHWVFSTSKAAGDLSLSTFYPYYITFYSFFLSLFLAIASASKALNIFRDSSSDGTELIFLAKPITRPKILLSKFTSFWAVMGFYVVAQLPLVIIGAAMAKTNVGHVMLGFLISSFFTILIFGNVAILLASALGTVGTLLIQICITLFFFTILNNALFGNIPEWADNKFANYFDLGNQLANMTAITVPRTSQMQFLIDNTDALIQIKRAPPYWATILISFGLGGSLFALAGFIYSRSDFK